MSHTDPTDLPVAPPPVSCPVRLDSADLILINISGGKDSQVALDVVVKAAREQGVQGRIVTLYNDLGRSAWGRGPHGEPSAQELAALHAAHYDLPFHVRRREQGDLMTQVEQRRASLDRKADELAAQGKPEEAAAKRAAPAWPSASERWCTSDQKRGPKHKLMTQLVRGLALDRPARIIDVTGERAEESRDRARRPAFEVNSAATNLTRRHVWTWRPIQEWNEEQVWAHIKASGVPSHWAYAAGMRRLSCVLCIMASKADLVLAAQLNPELAAEHVALEQRVRSDFKHRLSLREIVGLAQAEGSP